MQRLTPFRRAFGQIQPVEIGKQVLLTKDGLRGIVRRKLEDLPVHIKEKRSDSLSKEFIDTNIFKYCQRFAIYQGSPLLVNTDKIILSLFENDKDVYIPIRSRQGEIDLVKQNLSDVNSQTDPVRLKFKASLKRANALSDGGVDVIVIPGLAFTRDGYRLGNGMWKFDKFLQKYFRVCPKRYAEDMPLAAKIEKHKTILIGLALEEQIIPRNQMPLERQRKLDLVFIA